MSREYTNEERKAAEAHVQQAEKIVRNIKERIVTATTFIDNYPNISRAAASVAANKQRNIDIPKLLARAHEDLVNVEKLLQTMKNKLASMQGGSKRNRNRTHRKRNHKRKCTRRH